MDRRFHFMGGKDQDRAGLQRQLAFGN